MGNPIGNELVAAIGVSPSGGLSGASEFFTTQQIASLSSSGSPNVSNATGLLPIVNGGTGLTTVGSAGQVLQSNGTALVFASSGGSPGGTSGQIQYNNAGSFGGVSTIPSGNIQSFVPYPRNALICAIGTSLVGNVNSFYESICLLSGGKLKRQKNGGNPGQTAQFIADRLLLNSTWWKPGIVVMAPSRNDGFSSQSQTYLTKMIAEARKSGALVVVMTEYGDFTNASAAITIAAIAYNTWLVSYVASLNDPGVIVSNLFGVMCNPNGTSKAPLITTTATNPSASLGAPCALTVASATGITIGMCVYGGGASGNVYVTNISGNTVTVVSQNGSITAEASPVSYTFNTTWQDLNHPGTPGGALIAQQALTDMSNAGFLNGLAPFTALDATDTGNVFLNGTLEGTVTNGLAADLSSTVPSAQLSVVTDSNFRGFAQQVSIAPGQSGGFLQTQSVNVRAYRGRKMAASMKMSMSNMQSTGQYLPVFATFNIAPQNLPSSFTSSVASAQPFYFQTCDFEGQGMVWYGECYVPTNATAFSISMQFNANPSANANTTICKIGELSLIDIDDPEKPSIHWQDSVDVVAASVTLDTTYEIVLVNATSGAINITLATPSTLIKGKRYTIKKTDVSVNAVTIIGTVDTATNPTLANQFACMVVECDGTAYQKISQYLT